MNANTENPIVTETPEGVTVTTEPAAVQETAPPASVQTNGTHQYFKKLLATNMPFRVNGDAVAFELLERNTGVLKIDPNKQPDIVTALNEAADRRKLGIVRIDAATYEELKKKQRAVVSEKNFGPPGRNKNVKAWRPPPYPQRKPDQRSQLSPSARKERDAVAAVAGGNRISNPVSSPPKLNKTAATTTTSSKAGPGASVGGVTHQPVSGGGPGGDAGVMSSPAAQPAGANAAKVEAKPATKQRGPRLRPQRTASEPSKL